MSNQIRYCLSQYIQQSQEDSEPNSDQPDQVEKPVKTLKKEEQSIISPALLMSMIQQQKSMLLSVVGGHELEESILKQGKSSAIPKADS
jgi:hypothetical protein